MKFLKNINNYLPILLVLIVLGGAKCKKDEQSRIPYVAINRTINTSLPDYQKLTVIGNYITLPNEGSKGVIIYHSPDGYVAYDMHCPHDPYEHNGKVYVVEPENLFAKDSVCGSVFSLIDGNVQSGVSEMPLEKYKVYEDDGIIRVTN